MDVRRNTPLFPGGEFAKPAAAPNAAAISPGW
jgi:hypothetical protein